ncbi:hypothetical protein RHMOL_Rhmol13G0070600 [Rhododendron molle]|uniref:Uncharacterized protein n=1 Tax=Rhododendron molle TaxID=49168 RepID=A0ACC0L450_RHOML|nr:hypothetical protein RHMOL_Rhmol13G0070600 [Rhododendron molle]
MKKAVILQVVRISCRKATGKSKEALFLGASICGRVVFACLVGSALHAPPCNLHKDARLWTALCPSDDLVSTHKERSELLQGANGRKKKLDKWQITRKKKLDKKLKTTQTSRRVSSIIFIATVTAFFICSVVAAAVIAAPLVAAAQVAISAVLLGSVEAWIDSLWTKYEDVVKG